MNNPNERPPEAFGSREVSNTRGVKLSNNSSKIAKMQAEKEKQQQTFEERAEQLIANQNEQMDQGLQLAKEFLDAVRSKVLPANRGTLGDDHERALRDRFVDMVVALNNNPHEKYDGAGSAYALKLLMRTVFLQRDKINDLAYRLQVLEKKVSSIEPPRGSDE